MITVTTRGTGGAPTMAFAARLRGALRDSEREEAQALAPVLARLADASYDARQSPDGQAWRPRVGPTGGWPLLEKTGRMRRSRQVTVGAGFLILAYDMPGEHHQNGTARMTARQLLPSRGRMPPGWAVEIQRARREFWRQRLLGAR